MPQALGAQKINSHNSSPVAIVRNTELQYSVLGYNHKRYVEKNHPAFYMKHLYNTFPKFPQAPSMGRSIVSVSIKHLI